MQRTATQRYDVAVIGAGAAGQFCAALAGQGGLAVALLDHAAKIGEKIRISGGGRCNFTNLNADDERRYLSRDARFARYALRAFRPSDFLALVHRHGLSYHEKHRGQLFCDQGSTAIQALLAAECRAGGVHLIHPVIDLHIEPPPSPPAFEPASALAPGAQSGSGTSSAACQLAGSQVPGSQVAASRMPASQVADSRMPASPMPASQMPAWRITGRDLALQARAVVIATGGPSIAAIGGSDFAWQFARRLGLATVAARPGLVPITCDQRWRERYGDLAGVSLPVRITLEPRGNAPQFDEDLLFTHRGLSGPAILQISSYRDQAQALRIDLAPDSSLNDRLMDLTSRSTVGRIINDALPRRLALALLADSPQASQRPVELGRARLAGWVEQICRHRVVPTGTEGLRKAEVTCGGIATAELDPRTMAVRRWPGLYVIGEAADVTGWLGGYNFQWAWSSAAACAAALGGRQRGRGLP